MPTVLIAGGTGLVGTALTEYLLQKNYFVTILTRSAAKPGQHPNLRYAQWNTDTQTMDAAALAEADYIVNLAGAGVADKRWTKARKKEIQLSRVSSGQLITKSLKEISNKVKAIINASAIGYYGADPTIPNDKPFVEIDKTDTQFLGETCKLWEESVEGIKELNIPLIKLRIGIVLSNEGGALKEFKKPLQFGIAAILGSGKQMISWIHLTDLCRMIEYAMLHEKMEGVYNAVAPKPVKNKTLTVELGKRITIQFTG
ncbi:MAG: TIGR01777 family protein [Sphingobacteriales bacterium]|nr:TIGR01777 family protein [Sphingobacteriales bacterium]